MATKLDKRIVLYARITWVNGDTAKVVSIVDNDFSLLWEDGRVMGEYSNADLVENGGNITKVEAPDESVQVSV